MTFNQPTLKGKLFFLNIYSLCYLHSSNSFMCVLSDSVLFHQPCSGKLINLEETFLLRAEADRNAWRTLTCAQLRKNSWLLFSPTPGSSGSSTPPLLSSTHRRYACQHNRTSITCTLHARETESSCKILSRDCRMVFVVLVWGDDKCDLSHVPPENGSF